MAIAMLRAHHGGEIAVNASRVTHMTPNGPQGHQTIIHFDEAHSVTVEGRLAEIVDLLRNQR